MSEENQKTTIITDGTLNILIEPIQMVTIAESSTENEPQSKGIFDDSRGGADAKTVEAVHDLYGQGLELAERIGERTKTWLAEQAEGAKPDEFEIAFSIGLSAEVGAFLAKASTEAQLQVTMKWNGGK